MKIFEILNNPLIKLTGIVAILYFALFANTENPESLGNRLSPQQMKKDFGEVKDKSLFIITNVKMAQEIAKNTPQITIEDIESGAGENAVSCGDEVEISYGIFDANGKQLQMTNSQKLQIGSKENDLVEKNIINMKKDGIRNIIIPANFQTEDKRLQEILKFSGNGIRYQIVILSLAHNKNSQISCQ